MGALCRPDRLLSRQNKVGGWGQDKDLPSDAYATGQALYFLSLAGVKHSRAEIQRAVAFLLANQKEDGSWPMTSRAHPGEKPFTNPVPITYFGSAWATLGLLRSVPK
jgi:squalene cyclase